MKYRVYDLYGETIDNKLYSPEDFPAGTACAVENGALPYLTNNEGIVDDPEGEQEMCYHDRSMFNLDELSAYAQVAFRWSLGGVGITKDVEGEFIEVNGMRAGSVRYFMSATIVESQKRILMNVEDTEVHATGNNLVIS